MIEPETTIWGYMIRTLAEAEAARAIQPRRMKQVGCLHACWISAHRVLRMGACERKSGTCPDSALVMTG